MSAVNVALEKSCWTAEYLLAHCERYRVESNEGKLGYVEEVIWTPDWTPDGSEPLALRVRTGVGSGGFVTIMVEDVLELHPKGERIVVRAQTGRAKPPETHGPRRGRRSARESPGASHGRP